MVASDNPKLKFRLTSLFFRQHGRSPLILGMDPMSKQEVEQRTVTGIGYGLNREIIYRSREYLKGFDDDAKFQ